MGRGSQIVHQAEGQRVPLQQPGGRQREAGVQHPGRPLRGWRSRFAGCRRRAAWHPRRPRPPDDPPRSRVAHCRTTTSMPRGASSSSATHPLRSFAPGLVGHRCGSPVRRGVYLRPPRRSGEALPQPGASAHGRAGRVEPGRSRACLPRSVGGATPFTASGAASWARALAMVRLGGVPASAIVLAHGAEPHLDRCVRALSDDPAVAEVVVVDNQADRPSVEAVRAVPRVRVLSPGEQPRIRRRLRLRRGARPPVTPWSS